MLYLDELQDKMILGRNAACSSIQRDLIQSAAIACLRQTNSLGISSNGLTSQEKEQAVRGDVRGHRAEQRSPDRKQRLGFLTQTCSEFLCKLSQCPPASIPQGSPVSHGDGAGAGKNRFRACPSSRECRAVSQKWVLILLPK